MAEVHEILTKTAQWLFCGCREDFHFLEYQTCPV